MIVKHTNDVPAEPQERPGFSGMSARFLLTADDGCPRYALRLMEFAPGGCTSYHRHKEEHEMYILEGEGVCVGDGTETPVRAGDAIYVAPCEYHQMKNAGGSVMRMICTVPLFLDKDGRTTTPCDEQAP